MKELRDLGKNLRLRLIIVFLGSFSYGTVFSSMTIYYTEHFGALITGGLLAVSSILAFLSGLLAGFWSDKKGRRSVMLWGAEIFTTSSIVAIFVNSPVCVNYWVTYFSFLFISIGYNFILTSGNAMLIDVSDVHNRKTVFSLDYWAQNLAVIFGAAIGAWLFKPAFFILLIFLFFQTLTTLIITLFFVTETKPPGFPSKFVQDNIFESYKRVVMDKTYLIYLIANILSMSITLQFDNFLPVHLQTDFQTFNFLGFTIYGQRMLTFYLILSCILVVLLMTSLNRLTSTWSNLRAFNVGTMVLSIGMGLSFIWVSFWPIIISSIIYTLGEIIYTPAVQTIGSNLMDPEKIGAYNGASSIRFPASSIVASFYVTLSPVLHKEGITIMMLILAIISCLLMSWTVKLNHTNEKP
ncbi:MDR family MFS transporter [Lactovum miscens]|uniref:DHA1 family multidrug resistance protein B-like MFS transporter n=1 Tax=Lactovum miscens TaxID=190387 RepID=A0A841CBJ6_9LACT|nr:MFS transporter [Lactovum miscens]MBB5888759.1 DHA1 family multidrug resistance protein B-like MFS transporter [Lactovum miscens]